MKYNIQKVKADNPKLKNNIVSLMWQKRRTQQQYAKAAKDAKKAAQAGKKTSGFTVRAVRAAAGAIAKHPVVIGVILAVLASLLIAASMFMAFMNMAVSRTLYAHCSELLVSVGDEITQGDIIAKVGSTGDSTGNHLHFEVKKTDCT